jgi:hypothetical protein
MLQHVAVARAHGEVQVSAQDSGTYGRDWVQLSACSTGQERGGYVLLSADEARVVAASLLDAADLVAGDVGMRTEGMRARDVATTADHR